MKLLIIGSKGFIGSHALKYYAAMPHVDCWASDVVVDYTSEKYILLDSSNSDFNEVFEEHRFNVCINCSGAASVPDSLQHPFRDYLLNTLNVVKILEAIRKHVPNCKFINLSSAAIYGNPKTLPINETTDSSPVSPYGMHKFYAEQICKEYYTYFGVQSSSLRIFSAFGPGLKKQLLWDIAQKTKASIDGKVYLFGTGNETRDFIYVEDIIRSIDLILQRGVFQASIYNIANGVPIKIKDLAEILLKKLDFKGTISFSGEQRIGDPLYWQAGTERIKQLGYVAEYTIEQGIQKYVQWLKEEKLH